MESFEASSVNQFVGFKAQSRSSPGSFAFYATAKANPVIFGRVKELKQEPLSLRLLASVFQGLKPWALSPVHDQ